MADKPYLLSVIRHGTEKAREVTQQTLDQVKEEWGCLFFELHFCRMMLNKRDAIDSRFAGVNYIYEPYLFYIWFYQLRFHVGIVKISDELHEYLRRDEHSDVALYQSQAEFWIKIGMQAEMNPDKTFTMLVSENAGKESVSRKGEQHE